MYELTMYMHNIRLNKTTRLWKTPEYAKNDYQTFHGPDKKSHMISEDKIILEEYDKKALIITGQFSSFCPARVTIKIFNDLNSYGKLSKSSKSQTTHLSNPQSLSSPQLQTATGKFYKQTADFENMCKQTADFFLDDDESGKSVMSRFWEWLNGLNLVVRLVVIVLIIIGIITLVVLLILALSILAKKRRKARKASNFRRPY